jgi:hypothetical protein
MGVDDIVGNPESAVFGIFGAILGGRNFGKATRHHRTMCAHYVKGFGDKMSINVAKVEKAKINSIWMHLRRRW